MAALFIRGEMAFWKMGVDARVPPQKIYLIEQLQTHRKLHEFLRVQKHELQDVGHVYDDLKFEQILAGLSLGGERLPSGAVVCSRCQQPAADAGDGATPADIKGQILARAKISIAKHLRDTNLREYARTKTEKGAETAGRTAGEGRQLAASLVKPKKVIPTHQILGKLQKTRDKIREMVGARTAQVLDAAGRENVPNSRDMDIIWHSVLGTFSRTFDMDTFRGEERRLKQTFRDSEILSGIQPWLLYFNLPEALIDHRLVPQRLLFPGKKRETGHSFATIRQVVDFFEKRAGQEATPNVILFQVEEGGQDFIIGGYSSHAWSEELTGDASSFIFNMTDNLRFNAIEKLAGDFYTKTEDIAASDSADSATERGGESRDFGTWESQEKKRKAGGGQAPSYTLSFGETELVIRDDFETVTSDFRNSYQFALNGDPLQIDKLRSVINRSRRYKPTKVEIWVFEEAPAIFDDDDEQTETQSLTHSHTISSGTSTPHSGSSQGGGVADRSTPLNA